MVHLDGMKPGDHAGLIALQSNYATVGIEITDHNEKYLVMCTKDGEIERIQFEGEKVGFKITFDFEDSIDIAQCFYSAEGKEWTKIGCDLKMLYTLDHFMGYRMGLFNYATEVTGGFTDFEYFEYWRKVRFISQVKI